jgi:hypothetical protein
LKNEIKYHFNDFTRKNLKRILKIAGGNYRFVEYGEKDFTKKSIFLRHDVDFSVNSAFALASIEAGLKIKSTFFLLPHSDFYNLFEDEITSIIRKIIESGHKIGLHFDCTYYNVKSEKELVKKLNLEKNFLQNIFETDIKVFSFHNPDKFALSCKDYRYAGMINTYSDFFNKKVTYISDSNGYWRFNRLEDILKEGKEDALQILLHPEWWQAEVMSPKERVWRCIDGRAEKTRSKYVSILKKFKRENIDW